MADPVNLTVLHQNLDFHYPKTYLNAWAAGVRPDWATFLFNVFREDVPRLLRRDGDVSIMDLGCGPSICNIISASMCSDRILMAELLPGNRREIVKFLCDEDDAWNWDPYFEFQVSLEEGGDVSSIAKRVKKSIRGVYECNLARAEVFEADLANVEVDVMICSLVFDVVCTDLYNLALVIRRALRHVSEDGVMVVQGSLGEQHYTVGSALLPVLNINEEEFLSVIRELDLEVLRWEVTRRCSTHYFTILRRVKEN